MEINAINAKLMEIKKNYGNNAKYGNHKKLME